MSSIESALRELVACYQLKKRADAISPVEPGCEKEVLMDDWRRRLPAAWKRAEAAIADADKAAA